MPNNTGGSKATHPSREPAAAIRSFHEFMCTPANHCTYPFLFSSRQKADRDSVDHSPACRNGGIYRHCARIQLSIKPEILCLQALPDSNTPRPLCCWSAYLAPPPPWLMSSMCGKTSPPYRPRSMPQEMGM